MKTLKNIFLTTLPTLIVLLIILEIFFRIVIPASNPPASIFNEEEKMYFFSNKREEGLITIGRFAEIKAKWRINNMNWNYPIDYQSHNGKNLIAVIGDSYIESFQVNVGENYPFLLREKLLNKYEVYAFGISGAPLSQYLNISRYVKRHLNPSIFIINLVHNDFDESIQELNPNENSFLKVSENEDGSFSQIIPGPTYSYQQYRPLKRFIFKSALFRYLYLNLHASELKENLFSASDESYEANINPHEVRENQELIFKATDYLAKTFREENEDVRIIFLIDAPRDNIYNNTLDASNVLWINKMMDSITSKNNIEYIDLTEYMYHDYLVNERKFSSEIDGHWDEYGHEFVADVLYNYLKEKQ